MNQAARICELLELQRQPVAVKIQDSAPEGISRIAEPAVSGCTYWKLAAEGQTFYTEAPDHYGCPVGSHTHGIDLPEDTAKELEGLIGKMVDLQYIAMEEVPGIPQLQGEFGVAVYAPLADCTFDPDVVLIVGNAKQLMLLAEAAHAAGVTSEPSVVGRPTCAAIPALIQSGQSATNLGCIGNRVYTGLTDDELYFAVAFEKLDRVVDKLETVVNANSELESFHRQRVAT